MLLLSAIVGIFLLCSAGKIVDRASLGNRLLRPLEFTLTLVLLLVPLAWLITISALNSRNVSLRVRDGRLVSTEWTGRVVTVEQPREAVFLGGVLVIAGPAPAVLAPGWWAQEDLDAIFGALRIVPRAEAGDLGRIRQRYPGARLPFSVRRPWLYVVGTLIGALGYLFLVTYLVLHF